LAHIVVSGSIPKLCNNSNGITKTGRQIMLRWVKVNIVTLSRLWWADLEDQFLDRGFPDTHFFCQRVICRHCMRST